MNTSNIDEQKNDDYEYNKSVSIDKSQNEYSDLNNEHNWRNKNEKATRKRIYLQPRPDFTGSQKKKD